MHYIVHFSYFVSKCRKHNDFCCDFLLGLSILSFVANFEVVYFLYHRKWITSCFEGLNQSHAILPCIFSVFSGHKPGPLWSPNVRLWHIKIK